MKVEDMDISFDADKNSSLFKYLKELSNETNKFTLMDSLRNKYDACDLIREYKILKKKKGKRYIRTLKYNDLSVIVVCR